MNKGKKEIKGSRTETRGKGRFRRLPLYARVLIIVTASIVLIGALGAGGFFIYINSVNRTIGSINTAEIENILTPLESPEEPVTILILGRDSRDTESEMGRADTIMLLYLDPGGSTGSLLSIPRDTLVEIPGYGEDKINAAYAYGGEELMVETVTDFLHVEINHYVTLDFEGFVQLVDALGGVDVEIDRPLVDPKSGANFSPGNHHLTGEQALAYSRSRSTETGDIGRIQLQQHLFRELVSQKLNVRYMSSIPYYFNILIENTRTDLDVLTILKYSKAALSFDPDAFETSIIPTYSDWIKNGTISVQIPDIEEARAMWQRIRDGQPASRYNAQYIEVDEITDSMTQEGVYKFKIKVKNIGALAWNKNGDNPVYLGYHWIDFNSNEMIVLDGKRSIISEDGVIAGKEVLFELTVLGPPEAGEYILQIDLVHEGVTWFSFQGVQPLEKYVTVDISYAAQYDDGGKTPNYMDPGQEFDIEVNVKNTGFMDWQHTGHKYRVNLGTHWLDRDTGEMIIWDGDRGLLTKEISHNGEDVIMMELKAPDEPGRYILQYDMAHEGVSWFSEKGVIPLEVNIDVGKTLDMSIVKTTSIQIFNGNGAGGSAGQVKDYLISHGFKVHSLANADKFDYEESIIIYNKGRQEEAQQLQVVFENSRIYEYNNEWNYYKSEADLVLIVGKDYKQYID